MNNMDVAVNLLYPYSPLNTGATTLAACINVNEIPEKLRWPFILVQRTDRHANFISIKGENISTK